MKKTIKLFALILATTLLVSCGPSLKVLGSWSDNDTQNLQNKNVLVITKVKDKAARIEFEQSIKKELSAANIKASESFRQFTVLDPNKKISDKEIEGIVKAIKDKGYNAIVLTTLKDYNESEQTTQTGGYYTGGSYYAPYYGGFSSYYGMYSNNFYGGGMYVPGETITTVSKKYILETVTYDLDLPANKELISIVSVQLTDPDDLEKVAAKYGEKIVAEILNPDTAKN